MSSILTNTSSMVALQTLKAFRANQGLLLAGAVAYYALRNGWYPASHAPSSLSWPVFSITRRCWAGCCW